ncbi:MAG: mandelate racemase/muconate lactonizing enzyme family protein [Burkholderiales bacterium]|nr:mandelate racemase/muconate lactonizing enzyme family protein [Burkholderiales bacterium]
MSERETPRLRPDGATHDCAALEHLERVAWPQLELAAIEVAIVEAPIDVPVRGSFGAMASRVSVLVRVRDTQGAVGHGEVWANFPEGGAQYKAELVRRHVAPLLLRRAFASPWEAWDTLERQLARLTLQSGDFGAFAQACAGIDQAVWDLYCHRIGAPLWKLAGGAPRVEVYASGIGPDDVGAVIREQADAGHTRFKIKLGFGDVVDRHNLDVALDALPANATLYTDANQAWDLAAARAWLEALEGAGVAWCEEPICADTPLEGWADLSRRHLSIRVAAGENVRGLHELAALASRGGVQVIQPDLGKWGGLTGTLRLHALLAPDVWLCPHWLAGAVGLGASLQLSGALRGAGPVEFDTNPNPLRTQLLDASLRITAGAVLLADVPGLVCAPSRADLDWR